MWSRKSCGEKNRSQTDTWPLIVLFSVYNSYIRKFSGKGEEEAKIEAKMRLKMKCCVAEADHPSGININQQSATEASSQPPGLPGKAQTELSLVFRGVCAVGGPGKKAERWPQFGPTSTWDGSLTSQSLCPRGHGRASGSVIKMQDVKEQTPRWMTSQTKCSASVQSAAETGEEREHGVHRVI